LKSLAKPLALVGRDRLDIFRPAPGLVKDVGDRADRLDVLLQASVPLEDLLFGSVMSWNLGPGVMMTSVIHLISIIVGLQSEI
jgi:hypothetical protein